jgi:hypothetical protein
MGRKVKHQVQAGDRQENGFLVVIQPNFQVLFQRRYCLVACCCGECNGRRFAVEVSRFVQERTVSCSSIKRRNFKAYLMGTPNGSVSVKDGQSMVSEPKWKFHLACVATLAKVRQNKIAASDVKNLDKMKNHLAQFLNQIDDYRERYAQLKAWALENDIRTARLATGLKLDPVTAPAASAPASSPVPMDSPAAVSATAPSMTQASTEPEPLPPADAAPPVPPQIEPIAIVNVPVVNANITMNTASNTAGLKWSVLPPINPYIYANPNGKYRYWYKDEHPAWRRWKDVIIPLWGLHDTSWYGEESNLRSAITATKIDIYANPRVLGLGRDPLWVEFAAVLLFVGDDTIEVFVSRNAPLPYDKGHDPNLRFFVKKCGLVLESMPKETDQRAWEKQAEKLAEQAFRTLTLSLAGAPPEPRHVYDIGYFGATDETDLEMNGQDVQRDVDITPGNNKPWSGRKNMREAVTACELFTDDTPVADLDPSITTLSY